eukprot:PhM_4_TR6765/c0_g1_i1/m.76484
MFGYVVPTFPPLVIVPTVALGVTSLVRAVPVEANFFEATETSTTTTNTKKHHHHKVLLRKVVPPRVFMSHEMQNMPLITVLEEEEEESQTKTYGLFDAPPQLTPNEAAQRILCVACEGENCWWLMAVVTEPTETSSCVATWLYPTDGRVRCSHKLGKGKYDTQPIDQASILVPSVEHIRTPVGVMLSPEVIALCDEAYFKTFNLRVFEDPPEPVKAVGRPKKTSKKKQKGVATAPPPPPPAALMDEDDDNGGGDAEPKLEDFIFDDDDFEFFNNSEEDDYDDEDRPKRKKAKKSKTAAPSKKQTTTTRTNKKTGGATAAAAAAVTLLASLSLDMTLMLPFEVRPDADTGKFPGLKILPRSGFSGSYVVTSEPISADDTWVPISAVFDEPPLPNTSPTGHTLQLDSSLMEGDDDNTNERSGRASKKVVSRTTKRPRDCDSPVVAKTANARHSPTSTSSPTATMTLQRYGSDGNEWTSVSVVKPSNQPSKAKSRGSPVPLPTAAPTAVHPITTTGKYALIEVAPKCFWSVPKASVICSKCMSTEGDITCCVRCTRFNHRQNAVVACEGVAHDGTGLCQSCRDHAALNSSTHHSHHHHHHHTPAMTSDPIVDCFLTALSALREKGMRARVPSEGRATPTIGDSPMTMSSVSRSAAPQASSASPAAPFFGGANTTTTAGSMNDDGDDSNSNNNNNALEMPALDVDISDMKFDDAVFDDTDDTQPPPPPVSTLMENHQNQNHWLDTATTTTTTNAPAGTNSMTGGFKLRLRVGANDSTTSCTNAASHAPVVEDEDDQEQPSLPQQPKLVLRFSNLKKD